MIIPIRCFTCGKLLANIWTKFEEELQLEFNKIMNKDTEVTEDTKKTIECKILDNLEIKRYCCRRMILSNVDLCEKI